MLNFSAIWASKNAYPMLKICTHQQQILSDIIFTTAAQQCRCAAVVKIMKNRAKHYFHNWNTTSSQQHFGDKFRRAMKKAFHWCIITLDFKHIWPILKHIIKPTRFSGITHPDGHRSRFWWQIQNGQKKPFRWCIITLCCKPIWPLFKQQQETGRIYGTGWSGIRILMTNSECPWKKLSVDVW